ARLRGGADPKIGFSLDAKTHALIFNSVFSSNLHYHAVAEWFQCGLVEVLGSGQVLRPYSDVVDHISLEKERLRMLASGTDLEIRFPLRRCASFSAWSATSRLTSSSPSRVWRSAAVSKVRTPMGGASRCTTTEECACSLSRPRRRIHRWPNMYRKIRSRPCL